MGGLAAMLAAAPAVLTGCAAPAPSAAPTLTAESIRQAQAAAALHSAVHRGDYADALALARPLAEKGDPLGENILGLLYSNGWGVPKDYALAAAWYEKAASQGIEASQNNLGIMYETGQGVPRDYAKAAYWYRKAADQGAMQGLFNLAKLYDRGLGVPLDERQAADLFRRAAGVPTPIPANASAAELERLANLYAHQARALLNAWDKDQAPPR